MSVPTLPVTQDIKLRQHHVRRHLDGLRSTVPSILEISHCVAKTFNFNSAHLRIEWKMREIHRTSSLQADQIHLVHLKIGFIKEDILLEFHSPRFTEAESHKNGF